MALIDDAADEEEEAETFTVTLSGAQQATLGIDRATGTIADDDDPQVEVSFAAAGYEVAEGSAVAVTVELNGDPERQVVIALTARPGAGEDYTLSAQRVTFASDETERVVLVSAVDDRVDDDGERVELGFAGLPSGVTAGSGATTATVAIADDDARGVRVSERSVSLLEGGRAGYTVELESEPTAAVTVRVEVPAGTEVTVSPEELKFTAGNWATAPEFTVRAAEDEDALADEPVSLTHTVSGGDYGGVAAAGVEVTIIENDTPTLSIGSGRAAESAGTLEFEVRLSTASSNAVTVAYATADGTAEAGADYEAQSGTLSFAPGTTLLTVAVGLIDDNVDEEEAETFTVTLSGAQGAALPPQVASVTGTLADDDDPAVTVRFAAAGYAVEEGSEVAVTVELSGDPEREVEIPLTVTGAAGAGAGDYEVTAESVSFGGGETERMVLVRALDDAVDDDGESVELGFGEPLPAGVAADPVAATTAAVAIADDDARGVKVSEESVRVLEGGEASYTVELESEPVAAVTVSVSVASGRDLTVEPVELGFTASDWSEAATVTVSAAEDADTLADAAVKVTHALSGGDYEGLAAAAVTVTVIENDTPTLSIASGSAVENAGELALAVSLSTASSETVTVAYATVDGTAAAGADYQAQRGTLTLVPGSTVGTIAVALIDDAVDEAEEETFTVMLEDARHALLGFAQATVTLADDDDPAVEVSFAAAEYGVEEGAEVAVTVRLSADPERAVVIPVTAQPAGGAGAGDYTVAAAALTFGSGETARRIRVTAVDDLVDDDGESVTLGFGSPLPARVTVGRPATAKVRLGDDDGSGLRVEPQQVSVPEGADASYTVALDSQPAGMVTVTATVPPGTDLTVAPEELKFTVADWSEAQTVTVTAAADADALADAAVTVTHAASGGGYAGVTAAVTVTVIETDVGGVEHSGRARGGGRGSAGTGSEPEPGEQRDGDGGLRDGGRQRAGGQGLHGAAGRPDLCARGNAADAGGGGDRRRGDEEAETFTVTLSEARQAWVAIATATGRSRTTSNRRTPAGRG